MVEKERNSNLNNWSDVYSSRYRCKKTLDRDHFEDEYILGMQEFYLQSHHPRLDVFGTVVQMPPDPRMMQSQILFAIWWTSDLDSKFSIVSRDVFPDA